MRKLFLLSLVLCGLSAVATAAHAQSYYYVDCSGTNPSDFPTIGSALAVAGPNSYVIVTGTCNENVSINNAWNLNVGAAYGLTANITGGVSVTASNSVFLYGLNVTNPSGDAFDITSSHSVTLNACTAKGSQGNGVSLHSLSDVTVSGSGTFDDNGSAGINLNDNSFFSVLAWGGPVDISGNHGPGVSAGAGTLFFTLGNTTIEKNINVPGGSRPVGFGIQQVGASKVQMGNCFGTNRVSGNENGGIDVRENSQVSLWNCGTVGDNVVKNNGPVGISASSGSVAILYGNVKISGHTGPGIELYAQGQLYMYGPNRISQNGNAGDPRSAGVVIDGNSEAYLRGGTISNNEGPGILALVNSSVDSDGATFFGNTGGDVTCDSSSYLASDVLAPSGIDCRTPHHLGNHRGFSAAPNAPDVTAQKNKAAEYKKYASPK